MHLKRYRSKSVREALSQARAELGPNALVLSTRLVGEHGWRGWGGSLQFEVVAVYAHADADCMSRFEGKSRTHTRPLQPSVAVPLAAECAGDFASAPSAASPGLISERFVRTVAVSLSSAMLATVRSGIVASSMARADFGEVAD